MTSATPTGDVATILAAHQSTAPDFIDGERHESCSCGEWHRYCGASKVPAHVRHAEHVAAVLAEFGCLR